MGHVQYSFTELETVGYSVNSHLCLYTNDPPLNIRLQYLQQSPPKAALSTVIVEDACNGFLQTIYTNLYSPATFVHIVCIQVKEVRVSSSHEKILHTGINCCVSSTTCCINR